MEYYKHEFSRNVKDLDRELILYFMNDEDINELKSDEKHFVNLLKLEFIYQVELNRSYKNYGQAIYTVIQNHRAKFENDSELKKNTFYLITETELKRYVKNKYKYKMIKEYAFARNHSYGGEMKYYHFIKINKKIENLEV